MSAWTWLRELRRMSNVVGLEVVCGERQRQRRTSSQLFKVVAMMKETCEEIPVIRAMRGLNKLRPLPEEEESDEEVWSGTATGVERRGYSIVGILSVNSEVKGQLGATPKPAPEAQPGKGKGGPGLGSPPWRAAGAAEREPG